MFLESIKKLRKPKAWKHPQPITRTELQQLRDEFWDTAPHYGGQKGNRFFGNIINSLYISRAVLLFSTFGIKCSTILLNKLNRWKHTC